VHPQYCNGYESLFVVLVIVILRVTMFCLEIIIIFFVFCVWCIFMIDYNSVYTVYYLPIPLLLYSINSVMERAYKLLHTTYNLLHTTLVITFLCPTLPFCGNAVGSPFLSHLVCVNCKPMDRLTICYRYRPHFFLMLFRDCFDRLFAHCFKRLSFIHICIGIGELIY